MIKMGITYIYIRQLTGLEKATLVRPGDVDPLYFGASKHYGCYYFALCDRRVKTCVTCHITVRDAEVLQVVMVAKRWGRACRRWLSSSPLRGPLRM